MQLNKDKATVINLKDILFHLLYRWRSFVIAAIIGAVILCGYQYWTIQKTHNEGKLTKEERQYQIDLQQYHEDLATNRNTVKVYTKMIQEQNDYLEKSIYINLSSQSVWIASNKYLVKVDQAVIEALPQGSSMDPADSILPVYSAPLSGVTDEEALKQTFGTENTEYVSELIYTITNPSDNTVTIYVLGETKEKAQVGLALLHQQMEMLSKGKANEIAAHQLVLVTENITRGLDKSLSDTIDLSVKQESLGKTTEENQKILQTARQKLDKLETDGEPQAPGMHLTKMAVIGIILGVAILFILYTVIFVMRGSIQNASDITERYNLPLFGEFPKSGQLHKLKGIDKFLAKKEIDDTIDPETVYDNIGALIARKQEAQSVLLISSLPEEKVTPVCEELSKRLEGKTIEARADMLHHSDSIEDAAKADAVILVEEKHVSRVKDIDRMAETLMNSGANVIGCIVI